MENVPREGGALIVANHSGTVPIDSAMTPLALHDHHPAQRHLRMLAADLVFTMPIIAPMARKTGATLACNEDAERLMSSGELVGVWPEGFKGIGKPFSERYKLQRFGRGGFVSAALRSGVPIIPCSIVGAEEIYPLVGNIPTLARLLGFPYIPITPFFPLLGPLGLLPLPSKWIIEFGEPIETDKIGAERRRRPDAGLQPHRPGPRGDPADAVQAAARPPQRLLLTSPAEARGHDAEARSLRLGAIGRLRLRCIARPTAIPPAIAPAPAAAGTPILAALRPVRKSRMSQPFSRAIRFSLASGLTATGCPTVVSIGRSLAESEYAEHWRQVETLLLGEREDRLGLGRPVQRLADQPAGVDAVLDLGDRAERAGQPEPAGDQRRELGRGRGDQPDPLAGVEVQLGERPGARPDAVGHQLVVDLLAESDDLLDGVTGDEAERRLLGLLHVRRGPRCRGAGTPPASSANAARSRQVKKSRAARPRAKW